MLLLAPQHRPGGVDAGISEWGPYVLPVTGHGVVEAAPAEQAEVGHPDISRRRRIGVGWPADPPACQQVWGQAVDRLQHGQAAQGHLHAARGGGPRWVLVAVAAIVLCYTARGKRGIARPFQVGRVVVVQGEPLPEVGGQISFREESGQTVSAGSFARGNPVPGSDRALVRTTLIQLGLFYWVALSAHSLLIRNTPNHRRSTC